MKKQNEKCRTSTFAEYSDRDLEVIMKLRVKMIAKLNQINALLCYNQELM